MSVDLDLDVRPVIAQCGLCLHGVRTTESFCMKGLWSLHAYRYQGEMRVEGGTYPFRAGYISLIPPGMTVEWRFPHHAAHYYAHFRAAVAKETPRRHPHLLDMGEGFERFAEQFEGLIQFHSSERARGDVRLWDMLYQIRGSPRVCRVHSLHSNLQIALSIIRNHHSETLRVGEIAKRMGVSHNHLTQLFQAEFGHGAREFIRRERITRACHLLLHSSVSIKTIAIEVGVPDLRYFNKLVRHATGMSPRLYRQKSKTP